MAEVKAPAARPLSPHIQIYGWTWTMAMSIVHRITGGALYFGSALLAIWLVALASGADAFAAVHGFFGSWFGMLILFGYTWALMQHMIGGVRHLIWDFGHGMEPAQRVWMARLSLIGAVALTLLIWIAAFLLR